MNTGNSRIKQITVHKLINCVTDITTEHKLTDNFTVNNKTYYEIADSTALLSLTISEYNDRLNAFKAYIESLPEFIGYVVDISNAIIPDEGCTTGDTITYQTEFIDYECIVEDVIEPTYYQLFIINDGNKGSVGGAGIYLSGKTASYTVVPVSGYTFVGWEKCSDSGCTEYNFINYNLSGEIFMDSDKYLRTVYKLTEEPNPTIYRLTLINDFTKGDTKISGKYADYADFLSGATANFSAIPKSGYEFVRWEYCDDGEYTVSGSTSVFMDADKCFRSVYRRKFELTIQNDDALGTVSGAGWYYEGDTAYYSVSGITSGYTFVNWSYCANNAVISSLLSYQILMDSDKCIKTTYSSSLVTPVYYDLIIENDNTKGSVTGEGTYLSGTTAIFSVSANTNYEFVKWELCASSEFYSSGKTDNILMDSNKCLRAIYQAKPVEIFFNNIFDKKGIDHIDVIKFKESDEFKDYDGGYPVIHGTPDYADIEKYIDAAIQVRGYNLPIASSYYNLKAPDQLSEQYLNAKIGVSGDTASPFTYRVKVSTFLGGENNVLETYEYHRGYNTDWLGSNVFDVGTKAFATISGVANAGVFTYKSVTESGYLIKAISTPVKQINSTFNIAASHAARTAAEKAAAAPSASVIASAVFEFVAIVYLVIQVADIIWDFLREEDIVNNAINDVYRMTRGLYNNDTIKESKVKMNITDDSNMYGDVDSPLTSKLLPNTYYTYQDIETYGKATGNYGAYKTGDKYSVANSDIKFDFFPRGDQYDVSVAPPLIYYRIELEAVEGCYLSETKPIAFGFLVAPDKFATPSFDVLPDPNHNYWNYNDYAVFKDIKYCDFVLLNDLKSNNTNKVLRWFNDMFNFRPLDDYHNYYLGTFGNDKYLQQNIEVYPNESTYPAKMDKVREKNFVRNVGDLFTLTRDSGQVVHEYGEYEVVFCNEKFPQLVMNHTFINRVDIGDPYLNYIKKYWIYDEADGWEIKNGAMYKSSGIASTLYQDLSGLECSVAGTYRRKYRVVLDVVVNSGEVYIDCLNTWDVNLWEVPSYINPVSAPAGVVLDKTGKKIKITQTMRFNYFITTDNNPSTFISRIKLGTSSDFEGYIKECTIQRLEHHKAFESQRFVPLKSFNIEVLESNPQRKFYLVYKYNGNEYFNNPNIDINIRPKTAYGKTPKVTVDFGDGKVSGFTTQGGYIFIPAFSIQHTYALNPSVSNGEYLIKMTFTDVDNIDSFTCRSSGLISVYDSENLLYDSNLDLCYTSIGYPSKTMVNATLSTGSGYRRDGFAAYSDQYINNYNNGLYFNPFIDIYKLKSLYLKEIKFLQADISDLCNTISGDLAVSYLTNPDVDIEVTVNYRNGVPMIPVTGTTVVQPLIVGDLSYFADCKNSIYLDGTHISHYSDRYNIECKNVTWINHREGFKPTAFDLNRLIFDLYNSTIYGGMLKIDTNNPPISDPDIIDHINEMVSTRGWTIYYNTGGELIVYNGTGGGSYYTGNIATITAKDPIAGYVFDKWVIMSGVVNYKSGSSETTNIAEIIIGSSDITINATYKKI